ncbi:MAG: hypothetical protein EOM85_03050 [Candidatus Moranbacteria bacterium]|nr:hypothetical protein [Candidatus Moranbacteria bacterium]
MDLQQIYETEAGKLIRKHLQSVVDQMDKKTNIDISLPKDEIAIEVLSDIKAINKLKEILWLTSKFEKISDTLEDNKKHYGL